MQDVRRLRMTYIEQLRSAQLAAMAVTVRLHSNEEYNLVGVQEVDPEGFWAVLATPKEPGDRTTRVRIDAADIAAVSVSEVAWE